MSVRYWLNVFVHAGVRTLFCFRSARKVCWVRRQREWSYGGVSIVTRRFSCSRRWYFGRLFTVPLGRAKILQMCQFSACRLVGERWPYLNSPLIPLSKVTLSSFLGFARLQNCESRAKMFVCGSFVYFSFPFPLSETSLD